MRQFTYTYSSEMFCSHGLCTFVPQAKFFHPTMGFTEFHGPGLFQDLDHLGYSKKFTDFFKGAISFRHSVKIFFPEIKKGLIFLDKLKYRAVSKNENPILNYEIVKDDKYEDYIEIKDHLVEFEVIVSADFGKKISPEELVEIVCERMEFLLFNQRISIALHKGNMTIVPYVISYDTVYPIEFAKQTTKSSNLVANSGLNFGFVLLENEKNYFEKKGFSCDEVDSSLLDTAFIKSQIDTKLSKGEVDLHNVTTCSENYYLLTLPKTLFTKTDKKNFIPIFNPEIAMNCCDYIKAKLCSPYAKQYKIPSISECPKSCPKSDAETACKQVYKYEVINKAIIGYVTFSLLDWKKLDEFAKIIKPKEQDYIEEV